ncbi:hypothetical protein J2T60_001315 [Natronospira proteinivora]|uniref:Uncharacterized protein n=1 Tax=Natronospira proteinivora TaxID=1807133 RepID=A0ABT1G7S9_9GAMM|nr:hypothetical protein [Natronospira proteinivora]MCP1727350.1 hypothetical protein [Natronospira proteinivora]
MIGLFSKKMKGRPFMSAFAILFSLVALVLAVLLFIPMKDGFFGVPMVAYQEPDWYGADSFRIELEVPCNRFYAREIGFRIDPPVQVESMRNARGSVSGHVKVNVSQNGLGFERLVDLQESGWAWDQGGVWSKTIYRFSPLGRFFCGKQKIVVDANNINIDLRKHKVMVYVSRDRRP